MPARTENSKLPFDRLDVLVRWLKIRVADVDRGTRQGREGRAVEPGHAVRRAVDGTATTSAAGARLLHSRRPPGGSSRGRSGTTFSGDYFALAFGFAFGLAFLRLGLGVRDSPSLIASRTRGYVPQRQTLRTCRGRRCTSRPFLCTSLHERTAVMICPGWQ